MHFALSSSKVTVPAIRRRMLSSLMNVSVELAADVAEGLGMAVPDAMPKAISEPQMPEVTRSSALSMMALPGEYGIRTRQIAVLVEEGVHHGSLISLYGALAKAGAVVHFVGPRIGIFACSSGEIIEADKSMENSPAVLFDALVLPDGNEAVRTLADNKYTMSFIKDMYWHGKAILALGDGRELLDMACVGPDIGENESILMANSSDTGEITPVFIDAIAAHRHPFRTLANN